MTRTLAATISIALLALLGCAPAQDSAIGNRTTSLQIQNLTGYTVQALMIGKIKVGTLEHKTISQKLDVSDGTLYQYVSYKGELEGEPFDVRTIDFVGETPLEAGKNYVFNLFAYPENGKLQVALKLESACLFSDCL